MNVQSKINNIDSEIHQIKQRNIRVEMDKAWETSKTRIFSIAILTYVVVLIFFLVIRLPNAYLSAIVPTLGFVLSTLTLPFIKQLWLNKLNKGQKK